MRKRTLVIDVVLDNLSMTGAGVFVPVGSDVSNGIVAELNIGDVWGQVRVVRMAPTPNPGTMYCGLLITDANQDFHDAVGRLL